LVDTPKGSLKIKTNLIGRYNIYNILAAIAVAFVENIDFDIIEKGIQKINYIPGRLESINKGQRFSLFVDYAHTDDALRNVLSSLKEFNKGRIIVVFGCGGQRDISKRAKMGRIASNLADYCILTNDNPRNENPLKIINDILKGIKTNNFDVILDRQKAIEKAIELAKNKDTVLIAGKGHETSQLLKNKILPFDDREVVRKILRCLK
jgi:UDP-N-acetylmuramoyl-L-alanyl-D-glutamate--2,6-diaminopimelate ligase